jgi:Spy/CpxP family protein refolding chaperone
MKARIFLCVFLGVFVFIEGMAFSSRSFHIIKVARKIGLSEKQIERIRHITYQFKKKVIKKRSELQMAKLELQYYLDGANPKEEHALKLVGKIGSLETKLHKIRVSMLLKIRSLLTPAQWRKLRALKRPHKRPRPKHKEIHPQ